MNITEQWEDVFYIENMDDGTYDHRPAKSTNCWYVLRLRPNTIRNQSRHYIVACSGDLNNILKSVKMYVSIYGNNLRAMYESFGTTYNGCMLGKTSLEQADNHYSKYKYDKKYDKYIKNAIKAGRNNTIITGINVRVEYCIEKDEYTVTGIRKDFFEELLNIFVSFDGYTKIELYRKTSHLIDIYCLNDIFASLRENGCNSIKSLKGLSIYVLIDVLTPLVNSWSFVD